MNQDQEDKLLLQLIIQSLEKLDERLTEAADGTKELIQDLDQKVNSINITMARNTESLEAHMRRTIAAEEALVHLQQAILPIKSTYDGVTFTGKLIAKMAAALALLLTIFAGIWEAFKLVFRIP